MLAMPLRPVWSLDKSTGGHKIPTPPYINISGTSSRFECFLALMRSLVSGGYEESIASLIDITRELVHERLKGDAWVTWAIAQRASLPVKIEACVE